MLMIIRVTILIITMIDEEEIMNKIIIHNKGWLKTNNKAVMN